MKFEPFLALEASAGSGKTFALSVRFVALILMDAKINEILALTFTKKASNEMKKRIVETFLNLDKDSKKEELKTLCELLGKTQEEILNLRDNKKEEFLKQDLKISTFDAFFSKILRSFALNLGLMSDFEVSEEIIDIRDIFLDELDKKDKLKDLAFYILNLDSSEKFFQDLQKLYKNSYFKDTKEAKFPSKDKINQAYMEFKNYAFTLNHKNLMTSFKFDDLNHHLDDFLKTSFMSKYETTAYLQKFDEDLEFRTKKDKFFSVLNEYAKELEEFKISKLMALFDCYAKAKDLMHKEKNILSFEDVAKRVFDLIHSDLKDMIYFRLDGYISHLLIDEFQDTNVLQYKILKPIIEELVSGEGVKKFRSFFYVGDKKQSIYRFRNGKKELFDLLKQDFKQIKSDTLDTNYRSKELLVEFVNKSFENKYINYTRQKALDDESKKGGFIRIINSKENEDDLKEKTLQALHEQILFLKNKNISYDDICILCWKNDDADMILEFLRKNEIPAYTQSNILLENKASVRLVLEYAKYCIFGDRFYLEFLKSLLGSNQEFEKLKLNLSDSPIKNILRLVEKLNLNLNDIALIQFIEYAKTKDNFLELLFEPCPLKIISEESFGISIMSVHKSKGLEFDNVILLDYLTKKPSDNDNILLEYDINSGWDLRIKNNILLKTKESSYIDFLDKIEKARYEDDINKLYVAFTRAKNSLIIIKRNEEAKNASTQSYFNGAYLDLSVCELGELQTQISKVKKDKLNQKDKLDDFIEVDRQIISKDENDDNSKDFSFGNAFHYFMQNLDFDNRKNFDFLCKKVRDKFRYFLDDANFEDLFNRINHLLDNYEFKELLKDKKILKEQKISFNNELKQLDLLAFDENEAFIIDYKTGFGDKQKHKEQVLFYKNAIKEILNKNNTKAFLVYALKDDIKIQSV